MVGRTRGIGGAFGRVPRHALLADFALSPFIAAKTLYLKPKNSTPMYVMVDHDAVGHSRRRSVDVGGLALALGNQGLGHGWGGWEEREQGEIRCARSLISFDHLSYSIALDSDTQNCSAKCIRKHRALYITVASNCEFGLLGICNLGLC